MYKSKELDHCLKQFRKLSELDVDLQQFKKRLAVCESCELRRNTRCQQYKAGCASHAKLKSSYCGHWGEIPPSVHKLKEWQRDLNDKPIRLGFFMPTLSMGGISRVLLTIMTAPVKHGIEWSGFAIENPWTFDAETAKLILKHCPIYSSNNNPAYQGLVTIVPNAYQTVVDKSDVINPCGFTQSSPELDRVKWGTKPLLVVSHGQCEWTKKSLAVTLAKGSQHILASVSNGGVKRFPESLRERVGVIYNGADFSRCAPARSRDDVRREWGISPDTKVVGYVGRLAHGKKPLAVAEAVTALGDGYCAVYVGEGFQQDQVIEDVRKICHRAVFVPRIEDIGTALNAMDCVVSASPSEGGPLSVIEAWIAGCPAVSTSVGVIPELEAKHGPLVFSIPFDPTPQDLAAAVREAIAGDARIQRAKEMAWERFSSTRMVLGYEALIRGKYVSQS